jgi:hypothetical protein
VPFTYSISEHPPLAVVRAEGEVDMAGWNAVMSEVVHHPQFSSRMPILLDARQVAHPPAPGEAAIIAIRWRALAPRSRGAIVTTGGGELEAARQVEEITDHRLRAFTDLDAAREWLQSS